MALHHRGKVRFTLHAQPSGGAWVSGGNSDFLDAVAGLFGPAMREELAEFGGEAPGGISYTGHITKPGSRLTLRSSTDRQWVFVNDRLVDPSSLGSLAGIVSKTIRGQVGFDKRGRHPFLFLRLNTPNVDVNVVPNKREVLIAGVEREAFEASVAEVLAELFRPTTPPDVVQATVPASIDDEVFRTVTPAVRPAAPKPVKRPASTPKQKPLLARNGAASKETVKHVGIPQRLVSTKLERQRASTRFMHRNLPMSVDVGGPPLRGLIRPTTVLPPSLTTQLLSPPGSSSSSEVSSSPGIPSGEMAVSSQQVRPLKGNSLPDLSIIGLVKQGDNDVYLCYSEATTSFYMVSSTRASTAVHLARLMRERSLDATPLDAPIVIRRTESGKEPIPAKTWLALRDPKWWPVFQRSGIGLRIGVADDSTVELHALATSLLTLADVLSFAKEAVSHSGSSDDFFVRPPSVRDFLARAAKEAPPLPLSDAIVLLLDSDLRGSDAIGLLCCRLRDKLPL